MIAVLALPWEEKKEVEKVVEREMRRVERRTRRQGARAGPESELNNRFLRDRISDIINMSSDYCPSQLLN